MAKFLKSSEINSQLERIIDEAFLQIILISPYIKLHGRIKDILESKKLESEVKITIVYGKNDGDRYKSLGKEDFDFLKEFPNIEIKYESRLHAKFYANESESILSSMNLHEYSQNNNIEFGILTEMHGIIKDLASFVVKTEDIDSEANYYFNNVINKSELRFLKEPQFEKKFLKKKYVNSIVKTDLLTDSFNQTKESKIEQKESVSINAETGYCIRTGVKIPLNLKMPMSKDAFKNWEKFKNPTYPEKYDHFTGELTKNETCFKKPILRKNWEAFQTAIKSKKLQ